MRFSIQLKFYYKLTELRFSTSTYIVEDIVQIYSKVESFV